MMRNMKTLVAALLVLALSACANVAKMDKGDQALGERLMVTLDGPWNQVNAPGLGPAQTWTMEGLPVDQLRIYSGIKDGEAIFTGGAGQNAKRIDFRANMLLLLGRFGLLRAFRRRADARDIAWWKTGGSACKRLHPRL